MNNKILVTIMGLILLVGITGCNTIGLQSVVDINNPSITDFESGFGDFINVGGDNFDWTRDSSGTPSSATGPVTGNIGSRYYVFTESSGNNNRIAYLEGTFSVKGSSRLSFYHHMYGVSMGSLSVEYFDGSSWVELWKQVGSTGLSSQRSDYLLQSVDIPYYDGDLKIRFVGLTGPSFQSDMALDDIKFEIISTPCSVDSDCGNNEFCDFNSNICVVGCSKVTENVDCVGGQVCSKDLHGTCIIASAVGTSCLVDSDCAVGQTCGSNGQCLITSVGACTSNSECGVGGYCDPASGTCFTCPSGGSYNPISGVCEAGIITQQLVCSVDSDCPLGGVCVMGVCKVCPVGTYDPASDSCKVDVVGVVPTCENVCVDTNTGAQVSCS